VDATDDELASLIVGFLRDIGLAVRFDVAPASSTLPGVVLEQGTIVVDRSQPLMIGDLLHEAGHLALLPPSVRRVAEDRLDHDWGSGYEVGAICWSYAAAVHLGVPLEVVFHARGYRGDGPWLIETFRAGTYPGVALLEWAGLTWTPGHEPADELPFPAMRQWLRTTEIAID
jgi:hypothetical protein